MSYGFIYFISQLKLGLEGLNNINLIASYKHKKASSLPI